AERALEAADRLQAILSEPVSASVVPFDGVTERATPAPLEPVLAAFPPVFFPALVKAGWTPIMRYDVDLAIQLYQDEGRDLSPDSWVSTPPVETTAAAMAPMVLKAAGVEGTGITASMSHSACIRAVVARTADGCVTAPYFVKRYAQRFNIELIPVGEPVPIPPVALFASPGVTDQQIGHIKRELVTLVDGGFTYRPFVDGDELAYQPMYELATQ
ncbi:MAG: hypothetical protein ACPGUF_03570, partial [Litorivicinus sp.]